jgi:hypothetical protein
MSVATPVRPGKAKKEGLSNEDVTPEQPSDVKFPLHSAFVRPAAEEIVAPETLQKEYAEALAFADEPVEILIQPSSEKFGAKTVECWVNGKGIEVFDTRTGKWFPVGSVPRGVPVITKRKYVEVLLRSKTTDVRTNVVEHPGEDPDNHMVRSSHSNYPVQIIRDDNKKFGREWFYRMAGLNL